MRHLGIDVHQKYSEVCEIGRTGNSPGGRWRPEWRTAGAIGKRLWTAQCPIAASRDCERASIAGTTTGAFVVSWTSAGSYGSDDSSWSVQAQRYDSAGAPQGGQFQVNTYTTNIQARSAVGMAPNRDFVVVWESGGSFGTDADEYSVQGQRFAWPLFSDGFESGDTSAWSVTVETGAPGR